MWLSGGVATDFCPSSSYNQGPSVEIVNLMYDRQYIPRYVCQIKRDNNLYTRLRFRYYLWFLIFPNFYHPNLILSTNLYTYSYYHLDFRFNLKKPKKVKYRWNDIKRWGRKIEGKSMATPILSNLVVWGTVGCVWNFQIGGGSK